MTFQIFIIDPTFQWSINGGPLRSYDEMPCSLLEALFTLTENELPPNITTLYLSRVSGVEDGL